jgi:hypothetical protein
MRPPAAAQLWAAGNSRAGRANEPGRAVPARNIAVPALLVAAALAGLLVAGCGSSEAPVPQALPYDDPGFVEEGDWRLRYAVTLTRDLPAGVAGSYGIVPRTNLALVAITLERRDGLPGARVAAATLSAEAVALTGARTTLPLVRHDDAGGPTWLAPLEVRHRVPVTIEIRARATAASPEVRARLTREFRLD